MIEMLHAASRRNVKCNADCSFPFEVNVQVVFLASQRTQIAHLLVEKWQGELYFSAPPGSDKT